MKKIDFWTALLLSSWVGIDLCALVVIVFWGIPGTQQHDFRPILGGIAVLLLATYAGVKASDALNIRDHDPKRWRFRRTFGFDYLSGPHGLMQRRADFVLANFASNFHSACINQEQARRALREFAQGAENEPGPADMVQYTYQQTARLLRRHARLEAAVNATNKSVDRTKGAYRNALQAARDLGFSVKKRYTDYLSSIDRSTALDFTVSLESK